MRALVIELLSFRLHLSQQGPKKIRNLFCFMVLFYCFSLTATGPASFGIVIKPVGWGKDGSFIALSQVSFDDGRYGPCRYTLQWILASPKQDENIILTESKSFEPGGNMEKDIEKSDAFYKNFTESIWKNPSNSVSSFLKKNSIVKSSIDKIKYYGTLENFIKREYPDFSKIPDSIKIRSAKGYTAVLKRNNAIRIKYANKNTIIVNADYMPGKSPSLNFTSKSSNEISSNYYNCWSIEGIGFIPGGENLFKRKEVLVKSAKASNFITQKLKATEDGETWKYTSKEDHSKLLDGMPKTAWQYSYNNKPEKVVFKFDQKVTIKSIALYNGYGKSDKLFKQNGKAKKVRFSAQGQKKDFILDTSLNTYQNISVNFKNINSLTMEILEVEKGSKYNDIAISEINFYEDDFKKSFSLW